MEGMSRYTLQLQKGTLEMSPTSSPDPDDLEWSWQAAQQSPRKPPSRGGFKLPPNKSHTSRTYLVHKANKEDAIQSDSLSGTSKNEFH